MEKVSENMCTTVCTSCLPQQMYAQNSGSLNGASETFATSWTRLTDRRRCTRSLLATPAVQTSGYNDVIAECALYGHDTWCASGSFKSSSPWFVAKCVRQIIEFYRTPAKLLLLGSYHLAHTVSRLFAGVCNTI